MRFLFFSSRVRECERGLVPSAIDAGDYENPVTIYFRSEKYYSKSLTDAEITPGSHILTLRPFDIPADGIN